MLINCSEMPGDYSFSLFKILPLIGFSLEVASIVVLKSSNLHVIWIHESVFSELGIKQHLIYFVRNQGNNAYAKVRVIRDEDLDLEPASNKSLYNDKNSCIISKTLAMNLSIDVHTPLIFLHNISIGEASIPLAKEARISMENKVSNVKDFECIKSSLLPLLPILLDGRYGCPGSFWSVDWFNSDFAFYLVSTDASSQIRADCDGGEIVIDIPVLLTNQTSFVIEEYDSKEEILKKLDSLTIDIHSHSGIQLNEWIEAIHNEVGGLNHIIERVTKSIYYHLTKHEYSDILPKGFLFCGPSGTGKSFLASSIANTSGIHSIFIQGPDIYRRDEGEAEKVLANHFETARRMAPCIIVIDELDSIALSRGGDQGATERRILSCLVDEIDELVKNGQPVFVIGICHNKSDLDGSILRPHRIEDIIEFNVPSVGERREILSALTSKFLFGSDDMRESVLTRVSIETPGFTHADLQNVCRNAFISCLNRIPEEELDNPIILLEDFLNALDISSSSIIADVKRNTVKVTLDDIGGYDDIKHQLRLSVRLPFEQAKLLKSFGIERPKGIIIHGPTGTGKSVLIRAIAAETNANLISISGTEILTKVVGESENRLEDIFTKARLSAPCILYINQFDSIAQIRGNDGSEEQTADRILSFLLTEMDGFHKFDDERPLLIIAETNKIEQIDKTVLRPGRFDIVINMRIPGVDDRAEIFKKMKEKMPALQLSDNEILDLAKRTEGFTGADIVNLCKESALLVLKEDMNANAISLNDLERVLESMYIK